MKKQTPVPMTRMERKKEETRLKIISTALNLFQQYGIDATSMEQIAEGADIAKGTLYNYFPVKEAIISEYIQRKSIEHNTERIQRLHQMPDTYTRMVISLTELIDSVKEQKDIFEKYFVYRIQNMISIHKANEEKGLYNLEREIIKLGQASGEIRKDLPLEIIEGLFEFIFIEIAQQFYKDPESFNSQKTIEQCVELFLHGVKPVE